MSAHFQRGSALIETVVYPPIFQARISFRSFKAEEQTHLLWYIIRAIHFLSLLKLQHRLLLSYRIISRLSKAPSETVIKNEAWTREV